MINTYTWTQDSALQLRFDLARETIARSNHPLANNYQCNFNSSEIIAYSMSCTDREVYLCSSIARKSYWPQGVYRVLNRVFKPVPKDVFTKSIEDFWTDQVVQQLEFCKTLSDFKTAIVSRKLGYKRTLSHLQNYLALRNIVATVWAQPVWVCDDYHNPECQQNILAIGPHTADNFTSGQMVQMQQLLDPTSLKT
jgi:hypothetical protein